MQFLPMPSPLFAKFKHFSALYPAIIDRVFYLHTNFSMLLYRLHLRITKYKKNILLLGQIDACNLYYLVCHFFQVKFVNLHRIAVSPTIILLQLAPTFLPYPVPLLPPTSSLQGRLFNSQIYFLPTDQTSKFLLSNF